MDCNYFGLSSDYSGKGGKPCCATGKGYFPTSDEIKLYCQADDFMKCPRFKASLVINRSKNNSAE